MSVQNGCNDCKNSPRCIGGKCVANRIFFGKVKCKFDDKHVENVIKLLDATEGNKKIEEIK